MKDGCWRFSLELPGRGVRVSIRLISSFCWLMVCFPILSSWIPSQMSSMVNSLFCAATLAISVGTFNVFHLVRNLCAISYLLKLDVPSSLTTTLAHVRASAQILAASAASSIVLSCGIGLSYASSIADVTVLGGNVLPRYVLMRASQSVKLVL